MEHRFKLEAAVIGGDRRQIAVANSLTGLFSRVRLYGHSAEQIPSGVDLSTNLESVLAGSGVIVLPINGMNDAGLIRSYQDQPLIDFGRYLDKLASGTLVVTGSFTSRWRQVVASLGISYLEYAEDDEIAILNSIPTAEGAVQIAMEELPITIHGSTVLVVGFGRVGITVARVFQALGARVMVSARRPALLARAVEMGCQAVRDDAFGESVAAADIIINSVPFLIFTADLLSKASAKVLMIDLASAPGGIDFEAAARMGIKAKLYPGLPGIVAPETAGKILASSIPNLIRKILLKNGGVNDAV